MSYDSDCEAYSYVRQQNNEIKSRFITSSKEKIYLFEGTRKIFEMTKQCEILDTITVNHYPGLYC